MLKRFIFIVYLLLAILPMQSIASASTLVCNSKMARQSKTDTCHQHRLQQSEKKIILSTLQVLNYTVLRFAQICAPPLQSAAKLRFIYQEQREPFSSH